MSDNILAKRFKARRLELKMSQVQVAEGICKQARISRIEKGDYSPGAELLYKLAKKMHVSVEYFFDESVEEESFENLGKFKEVSRKLQNQRDYESLKYVYELELEKEQALSTSDKLYLEWIGCIVDFNVENKQKDAIKKLENLLSVTKETDTLYLTFINTLLIFYSDSKDSRTLEKYKEILNLISDIKTNDFEALTTQIRIKYNYAHHLWKNDYKEESKTETLETIKLCRKFEIMHCLGDCYVLLGNLSEEDEPQKAQEYFETALVVYNIQTNEKMKKIIEKYLKENFN